MSEYESGEVQDYKIITIGAGSHGSVVRTFEETMKLKDEQDPKSAASIRKIPERLEVQK